MATAAHGTRIYGTGASTAMTGEACTLSSGNTVATITAAAKRIIDPDTALVVYDNAVPVTDYTVNLLFGVITKNSGSFGGPVTVDGAYLPRLELDECVACSLAQSRDAIDVTVMGANNWRKRIMGLASAGATVDVIANPHKDYDGGAGALILEDVADAGDMLVLEVSCPGAGVFRMFARLEDVTRTAEVAGRVEATVTFSSTTGADGSPGFSWDT